MQIVQCHKLFLKAANFLVILKRIVINSNTAKGYLLEKMFKMDVLQSVFQFVCHKGMKNEHHCHNQDI